MYQFVGSPVHVQAISRVGVVSRQGPGVDAQGKLVPGTYISGLLGGSIVTSWEKALERLAAETRPSY